MSTAVDSANLILKLYEIRREETMRKARDFMFGFDPRSIEDVQATLMGPNGSYMRMALTYWEMAASFVVNGAIDAKMFEDANGEHLISYAKIDPFVPQLREMFGNPAFLKNLEQICTSGPGAREKLAATRERIRGFTAARTAAAKA